MIFTRQESKKIILLPNELGNIPLSIESKINELKNENMTKLLNIINWESGAISNINSSVEFMVLYEYEGFKPECNQLYKTIVQSIHKEGIICEIHKTNIIIPEINLEDWDFKTNMFVQKNIEIKVGGWIPVVLDAIRFENNKYRAIGHLKMS